MNRKLLNYKVPGCVVDGSVDIVVDIVVVGGVIVVVGITVDPWVVLVGTPSYNNPWIVIFNI
jgi:hypothetical protein